jgi:transposase
VKAARKSNDADMFRPLMERAMAVVNPTEVCADAGYLSKKNLPFIVDAGATPFIPFKHNSTTGSGGLWAKMLHFFRLNNEEFRAKYHVRSNAESTFSAIKRLFGANVLSRNRTAIVNEVLCKILCYKLTCVNHAQELLGIEPDWWSPTRPAA